jgi:hypothetical protein
MAMQIIVLENEPSSQRGGQELSLVDVSRELARRGHQLLLLYITPGNLLAEYERFCDQTLAVSQYRFTRHSLTRELPGLITDLGKIPPCRQRLIYCNQYQDSLFAAALGLVRGAG